MAAPVSAQVAGLQLSNNSFSASPPGSMSVADNHIISQKGVLEIRRGQQLMVDLQDAVARSMAEFQNFLIVNSGEIGSLELGYAAIQPGSTLHNYSADPFNPVGQQQLKFAQANDYLHFCCADGPRVLEAYNGQPRSAGLQQQPDILVARLVDSTTLKPGFLPYNSSVDFRTVLRRATSNGTSLLSPPSAAVVASNRIIAPIAALTRGIGTVTVTMPTSYQFSDHGLKVGGTFSVSPGEANFAAGTYTVATLSANTITYTDGGGGTHTSTVAQEINPGPNAVLAASIYAAISPDAVAGDFMRLYRSVNTSLSTVTPSPNLWLSNEVVLTGGDIAAGTVTIADTTPESQLFDPLYTNGDLGGGLDSGNYPPPLYRDVAIWQSQAWYLNTTGQQQLRIQMLGVGADNGIQNNDTLTIDGNIYTFKTSPSTGQDVQIVSSGLPAFNISQTTANLIQQVNADLTGNSSIRLYGDSQLGELGGKVLIQRTDFGAAFNVSASRALTWTPALTATSDDNNQPNNIAPSKVGQPEAVAPIDELAGIGSRSYPGLRVLALKQSLIICKGGDGIYAITGQPGNYSVRQISTANCIAPDCAAVFADQAWVYTDQGILKISDSGGCQVISRQIETELNALYAAMPADTYLRSFAVPYETERRILFYVPVRPDPSDEEGDRFIMEAFCYSNATQSWTKYNRRATCGVVCLDSNRLHLQVLGGYSNEFETNSLTLERKSLTYLDDADEDFAGAISAVDGVDLTLTDVTHVDVGDGISQTVAGTLWRSKIIAIDGNVATVIDAAPWTVAACTLYKSFAAEGQFLPVGDPAGRKSASAIVLLFKRDGYETALGKATCLTSEVQAEVEVAIPTLGFGQTPFGTMAFGNPSPIARNVSPFSPSDAAQYFVGIKSSEVWRKMLFEGFSLALESATGPAGRGT